MRRPATTPPVRHRAPGPAARLAALALAAVVVTGSCSSASTRPDVAGAAASTPDAETTSTTAVTSGRPRTVTILTETFIDPNRPTSPVGQVATAADERTLPTTIYLPEGEGPGPLIVFSHGLGGSPGKFTGIHEAWAEAGYIVAAPRFPLTSDANPDHRTEAGDLFQQPGDISFLLDQLLATSEAGDGPLAGRIDPNRVGAAGLSLGGATTYGLLMNDCCVDARVRAAVVMAGAVLIANGINDPNRGVPVLALHGDADLALPYPLGRSAWESLGGPAWLVTLAGADHAGPFEDFPTPWDGAVAASTIAFWDATLGGDTAAIGQLDAIAEASDGLVIVEYR